MNQIKCEFPKSRKFELFHYAHIVIGNILISSKVQFLIVLFLSTKVTGLSKHKMKNQEGRREEWKEGRKQEEGEGEMERKDSAVFLCIEMYLK